MKFKIIFIYLVIITLIGLGAYYYFFYVLKNPARQITYEENTPSQTYEPVAKIQLTDEEAIKALLDTKFNLDPSTTALTMEENSGEYAKGGYGASDPQGGGGLWFAARAEGEWQLVYDGNGIITCDALEDYPDFPRDLIPECWDLSTDKMVQR